MKSQGSGLREFHLQLLRHGFVQVSAADFDGIVIPGGYAPDIMRRYPKMVQLVKETYGAGKVVAAVCHAGWMLASAEPAPAEAGA